MAAQGSRRGLHGSNRNQIVPIALLIVLFLISHYRQASPQFNEPSWLIEAGLAVREAQKIAEKAVKIGS